VLRIVGSLFGLICSLDVYFKFGLIFGFEIPILTGFVSVAFDLV